MLFKKLFQQKEEEPQEPERGPMMISKFDTADVETLTAAFERRHKIRLPDSYRRFLLKYNGGETPNTVFSIGEVSSDLRAPSRRPWAARGPAGTLISWAGGCPAS